MATLATWFDRLVGSGAGPETASAGRRGGGRGGIRTAAGVDGDGNSPYRLRAYPNDDVCFWVKRIDNSRVTSPGDPRARMAFWRFATAASLALLLVVGVLLPKSYWLLAGYQVHSLERERESLIEERKLLEAEEARLLSPERLEELARYQELVDPPPDKVIHLSTPEEDTAALRTAGR